MTESYCTLFDSFFLSRGLALYESMKTHIPDFKLYIFAFDDKCYEILKSLNLPEVEVISLAAFETPELKEVKKGRSRGEYCWTCTPHIIEHVLNHKRVDRVTYLDADLFFFSSPVEVFAKFQAAKSDVLITEHMYYEAYDQTKTSGRFCVQFMVFCNTVNGRGILKWWGDRCLEWCFARIEDGKFGDQKYLDDWPTRFEGVYIPDHPGLGVAPWNVRRFKVEAGPKVDSNDVIFFHYHGLKWSPAGVIELCHGFYYIPSSAKNLLYLPYLRTLKKFFEILESRYGLTTAGKQAQDSSIAGHLQRIKHRLRGTLSLVHQDSL